MSAYRRRSMLLTGNKRAELVSAQDTYDQFFETLGTPGSWGVLSRPVTMTRVLRTL